jgi:hypothetical protein
MSSTKYLFLVMSILSSKFPNIIFTPFLLCKIKVKIGESTGQIKSGFIQYLLRKEESGFEFGLLLILSESIRSIKAIEEAKKSAVESYRVDASGSNIPAPQL